MISWRSTMYNLMYRLGSPRWDTHVTPPQVRALLEGAAGLPPGRALDLGCGTGTNVIYLAQHGWEAVGVDFSATAIRRARRKAGTLAGVTWIEGDVTQLARLDIHGPFDVVFDIGCFHGLPASRREAYVTEVARVTLPGALVLIWAIADRMTRIPGAPTMYPQEIEERFGHDCALERVERGNARWQANWYWLRRR